MKQIRTLLLATALGLWASAATAHHIAGSVVCTDTTPITPLSGVTVTLQGALNTVTGTTAADGTFYISLPSVTDTYTVTITPPAGLTITSPASGQYSAPIFANGVGGPDQFNDAHFQLTGCATPPPLGSIGDTVYCDTNGNGVQDPGEPGIPGVTVNLTCKSAAGDTIAIATAVTDANGKYLFVNVPAGVCIVTVDVTSVPIDCSVPVCDIIVTHTLAAGEVFLGADFCFTPPPTGPGTGTPGYWKNHPGAWPVESITIGGRTYSKSEAIRLMSQAEKGDKTKTVFRHLVSAKLNVLIGNAAGCITDAIATADAWMAIHPVGSRVPGSSAAWAEISGTATMLDDYNNGRLCAPHRD